MLLFNIMGSINLKSFFSKQYVRDIFVFLILMIISYVLGVNQGFDMCIDSYNYHIYNPWAFFHNRLGIDFMAADIQTYFNPLIDVPTYLLIKYLNNFPALVFGLNNLQYGIFIFVLYKLMDKYFLIKGVEKYLNILGCVVLAMTAPILMNEVNLLSNDTITGIVVLVSIYILFKYLFVDDSKKRTIMIALTGLIMGLVTGLKITSCFYCFAFFATMLFMIKDIQKPFKTLCYFCFSILIGFLITDGFWLLTVYHYFKNPFFPYFNNIFKSPYADTNMILDTDFAHLRAQNLHHLMFHPFYEMLEGVTRGYERRFFDARYLLTYLAIYSTGIACLYKNVLKTGNLMDKKHEKFLFIFVVLSYTFGMLIFGQYRYFIPLNALAGVSILLFLYSVLKSKRTIFTIFLLVLLGVISTDLRIKDDSIRMLSRGDKAFYVENMNIEDGSLVLLASRGTGAMLINQNQNAKYVYLAFPKDLNLEITYFVDTVYYRSDYSEKLLKDEINKHKENTYLLYRSNFGDRDMVNYEYSLKKYTNGKYKFLDDCRVIGHNNNPRLEIDYKLCKVVIGK